MLEAIGLAAAGSGLAGVVWVMVHWLTRGCFGSRGLAADRLVPVLVGSVVLGLVAAVSVVI